MNRNGTRLLPLWVKLTFALTFLLLLAGGAWFFRAQHKQQESEVADYLWSIAQIKAKQIADWRAEKLADAAVLTERHTLISSVKRFLSEPSEEEAREISRRLRPVAARYHFEDILLVDAAKKVRWSLNDKLTDAHQGYADTLEAAISTREPVWTELHTEPGYPFPHLSVVAPLYDPQAEHAFIGSLILISNASQFLYPLIQSWPTPSQTAETVLVRRDGDDVLFLNELRHRKDTALKLRIPLTRTDLPAAMAVNGVTGVVRGKDYRGVDVVAAILSIPDSPWALVAKMDVSEAFAEWQFRSLMILGHILGATALLGVIGLVLRHRLLKEHYRMLYRSESALRAAMERHSITLQSIGDAVIATDAEGRVEFMNPVAEAITGWSHEEASGKPIEEVFRIINEESRKTVENPVTRVIREGTVVGLANHTLLLSRNGREIPIADSGAPIRGDHGEIIGVVLVFRDQSEERLAQRLTEIRLSLIEHAAHHSLDDVLTRVVDEAAALAESPIGFYHFVGHDQKTLALQHWSTRTLEEFCRTQGRGMHYEIDQAGVWAECIHQRKPVIHNDYASLPHKRGLPEGHVPLVRELVVPVMRDDRVVAVLGVGNKPTAYTEKDMLTVSHIADVSWEIVSHKLADEALAESEARTKSILRAAPIGIGVVADRVFLDVNDRLCQLTGYSRDELIGRSARILYATDDEFEHIGAEKYRQIREHGTGTVETRFKRKDGTMVDVLLSSTPLEPKNLAAGIAFAALDITERKQANQALLESESRFRIAFASSPDAITINRLKDGLYVDVNEGFTTVTGYTREEAVGKTIMELSIWHDPADRDRLVAALRQDGHCENLEAVFQMKDGSLATGLMSARIIHLQGVPHVLSITRDITRLKEAEKDRKRLEAQLLHAQKMESVGRLAGGVAHDFNNMLNVILGHTEMLLMTMEPNDPHRAGLKEIEKAAQRSADLTRQLLAFARRQTIAPRVLDLNDTVEGMLKMLRRLIGEDIDLIWEPGSNLWPVKMDPAQVDQIVANLCLNARDAITGPGQVTLETENVVLDESYCADRLEYVPGDYVMLAVSDNGCGMDKEVQSHLFEPFFTTKEVGKGTGLGLPTVYGIVKQNNGLINVYSEPGKGTTIKLYIPRHEGEVPGSTAVGPGEMPRSRGETLLLVEDESAILNLGKTMLEILGYTVIAVGSPEEALEAAEEHSGVIHLLITDVVMPQMTGKDLADRLKMSRPEMKTLFMSGYTANVIAQHGVLKRGVHFIQKPFTMMGLATHVREALDA